MLINVETLKSELLRLNDLSFLMSVIEDWSMVKTTYTLAEAAKLLSCHTETLRRAIKDGVLRSARVGRGYRISRSDLQEFWSSRGGGVLFCVEPSDSPSEPSSRTLEKIVAPKLKDIPQQLSLLDSED